MSTRAICSLNAEGVIARTFISCLVHLEGPKFIERQHSLLRDQREQLLQFLAGHSEVRLFELLIELRDLECPTPVSVECVEDGVYSLVPLQLYRSVQICALCCLRAPLAHPLDRGVLVQVAPLFSS